MNHDGCRAGRGVASHGNKPDSTRGLGREKVRKGTDRSLACNLGTPNLNTQPPLGEYSNLSCPIPLLWFIVGTFKISALLHWACFSCTTAMCASCANAPALQSQRRTTQLTFGHATTPICRGYAFEVDGDDGNMTFATMCTKLFSSGFLTRKRVS